MVIAKTHHLVPMKNILPVSCYGINIWGNVQKGLRDFHIFTKTLTNNKLNCKLIKIYLKFAMRDFVSLQKF